MLGKNQAKILLRYYVKLSNHLISLHKPPFCFTLPTLLGLSEFCDPCDYGQISENIFFFLNLLCRKSSSTKASDSSSFLLRLKHLIALNKSQSHYIVFPSAIPSCLFSGPYFIISTLDFRWKLYCYFSPSHLMRENSVSQLTLCLFFCFVFWPIETTAANMQGLTYSDPCKIY